MAERINLDINLKKFAELIKVKLGLVVEKVTIDLHGEITKRTPVDTGRARASWGIGVGAPVDIAPQKATAEQRKKGEALYAAAEPIPNGEIDGTKPVFITSNVEYIEYLENGSSKQAPSGMVRASAAKIAAEIEATMAAILDNE